MDTTLQYYNENAASFADQTVNVDFSEVQERFLLRLPEGGRILDFGCGSGRDTKYFLSRGYQVDAVDGSEEMCRVASANTGIKVKRMLFTELDAQKAYDGIWACSSILHLPKDELGRVFLRMANALKDNGVIYTSFKYGEFEGYRNGRYFTDFTEEAFGDFIKDIPEIEVSESWLSGDVRPGRGGERWLNLLVGRSFS